MDSNQTMNSAADSQREKLHKLIALKKGKGGATQLEAKQFTDAWVALTKTVGVNDETIGLLYDGFQFAAGEPFFRYVTESKSTKAYVSLFSSKLTKANDQGIAFRVAINLLALELTKPSSSEDVILIARSIPRLSVNRDGKAFGTLGRSIGKILIKPLASKAISSDINLPRKDASALLVVLDEPVERFAKNSKTKKVELNAAATLLAWLKKQAVVDGDGFAAPHVQEDAREGCPVESGVTPSAPAQTDVTAKQAPRSAAERPVRVSRMEPASDVKPVTSAGATGLADGKPASSSKVAETQSSVQTRDRDMSDIISFLMAYQSKYEDLQARYDRAQSERRDALNRISVLEQQLRSVRQDNSKLQERVTSLAGTCSDLQSELNVQKEASESMRGDLEAAEEMLATIDKREARQADESTRRLARELRVEYTDFMDAVDLPMSVDLGENMRDQLRSVFSIVKTNGIEL